MMIIIIIIVINNNSKKNTKKSTKTHLDIEEWLSTYSDFSNGNFVGEILQLVPNVMSLFSLTEASLIFFYCTSFPSFFNFFKNSRFLGSKTYHLHTLFLVCK